MKADKVTAYLADTGEELWRYYANGPVRLAPAYSKGRLYFVSDDGYLYCLNANSGTLVWKFKGFFSEGRNLIGNERLISMWPARGGPVLADGIVYFASGILPFEGVFIHAVDAETGKSVWTNSTSGSMWSHHQHGGAWAYGGISPQGYLVVAGDRLIVSGGRTTPAVYDRTTGEFQYYRQENAIIGKGAGGYMVSAWDGWFANHGMLYSLENGAQYGAVPISVITKNAIIGVDNGTLIAHKSQLKRKEVKIKDRLGRGAVKAEYSIEKLWNDTNIKNIKRLHFRAGQYLAVNIDGQKAGLIKLSNDGKPDKLVWQYDIKDNIWDMLTAEGKLYIITESGKIYCFGETTGSQPRSFVEGQTAYKPAEEYMTQADNIISQTGVTGGYALCVDAGNGDLIKALIDKTSLHIISLEKNEKQLESLRRRFDGSGDYGKRVTFLNNDILNLPLPPYMSELIILTNDTCSEEHLNKAFYSLRPYNGKIYIDNPSTDLQVLFTKLNLENGKLTSGEGFAIISREGALKGAGQWTHQYSGASNRAYSDDELVKPPLGVLWFGGTSNLNALPRHQNGPIPQVAGGRLVILGINTISARCVYTGRELWVKEIPGIGHPFTSLEHEEIFFDSREVYMPSAPGANFIGSPYVTLPDTIYVIDKEKILLLDPDTGKTKKEFRLPFVERMNRYEWGHILVWEDLLVATVDPQYFDDALAGDIGNWNATSSTMLLVMNRYNGKVLWAKKADKIGFRHNAIIAGNGKLFVVDGLSSRLVDNIRRRGFEGQTESMLISFDIRTGKEIWKNEKDIFGTWLSYYDDRDILIQGGRHGQRGVPVDEPSNKMIAFKGETGEELWEQKYRYSGPVSLHEKMIVPGRPGEKVVDPVTGGFFQVDNPFTGDKYDWSYFRTYGCGTMNSSKYFVMFRSGAAGFNDLYNFGGTGNFGGFKASCTNNLVAADGVFNAPDVTRTCTCAYQLQTSLAMVHNPATEMWTHNHRLTVGTGFIKSLGINFGAPGNRRENGVLWVEYPKVYPSGPDVGVELQTNNPEWFRNHASWIKNPQDGYAWVASYGIKGIENVNVNLAPGGKTTLYDVVLYFAEPEEIGVGKRVFDVYVQGEKTLRDFDVVKQAGGERRVVTVQLKNVIVKDVLEISFKTVNSSLPPIISGIEIVASAQQNQ
ncbi:PQQ-binding-like beta-propeller repeat protein [bacterium]|nr:PQQ-binding-like beta-propeller repeat protein [bacterium]